MLLSWLSCLYQFFTVSFVLFSCCTIFNVHVPALSAPKVTCVPIVPRLDFSSRASALKSSSLLYMSRWSSMETSDSNSPREPSPPPCLPPPPPPPVAVSAAGTFSPSIVSKQKSGSRLPTLCLIGCQVFSLAFVNVAQTYPFLSTHCHHLGQLW